MKRLYLILLLILPFFIAITAPSRAVEDEETNAERFIKNLYSKPSYVVNKHFIEIKYGAHQLSIPGQSISDNISTQWQGQIKYGFYREDDRITLYDDFFKHGGEFTFMDVLSSHISPFLGRANGLTSEAWRFGFGLQDGYGYNYKNAKVLLTHSSAIVWSRIDFENPDIVARPSNILAFDEIYKFGNSSGSEFSISLGGGVYFNIGSELSTVYSNFKFLPWFGSWLTETAIQKLPEFYEQELMQSFGKNYGIVKFAYKTGISAAFWSMQRQNSFWPFAGQGSVSLMGFNAGFKFIF